MTLLAKIIIIVFLLAVALSGGAIFRNNVPVTETPGAVKRLMFYLSRNSVETRPDHTFPELRTRTSEMPVEEAYEAALAALEDLGWRVAERDHDAHTIHAVVTTPVLRFKDDVRISIESTQGGGSAVKVTSSSRVGRADYGANVSHVIAFYRALETTPPRGAG